MFYSEGTIYVSTVKTRYGQAPGEEIKNIGEPTWAKNKIRQAARRGIERLPRPDPLASISDLFFSRSSSPFVRQILFRPRRKPVRRRI